MKQCRFLMIALACAVLAGCRNTVDTPMVGTASASMETETYPAADIDAVYEVNAGLSAAKLPFDAQRAFDHADAYTAEGAAYQPVVLLGRQEESTYAILCYLHDDSAEAEKEDALYVVTIFEDEYGNAAAADVEGFNLSDFAGKNHLYQPDIEKANAFETNTEYEAQEHLPAAAEILDAKSDALYDAAALLGTSGNKSLLLCMRTRKENFETVKAWSVVTVETDSGTSKVLSVYELDPGAFSMLKYNSNLFD